MCILVRNIYNMINLINNIILQININIILNFICRLYYIQYNFIQ